MVSAFPAVIAIFKPTDKTWRVRTRSVFDRCMREQLVDMLLEKVGRVKFSITLTGRSRELQLTTSPGPKAKRTEPDVVLLALHELLQPAWRYTAVINAFSKDRKEWSVWLLNEPDRTKAVKVLQRVTGVDRVVSLQGGYSVTIKNKPRLFLRALENAGIAVVEVKHWHR